jgi:outer membrane protein assembly factor BamB
MIRKGFLVLSLMLSASSWALAETPPLATSWSGGAMDPGDWPQWRGPTRDGVSKETDLLDKWPEGGPPLLWKVTGLGRGLAAAVILKGRFYIVGDHDQSSYLQCYDLATQKQIWSTKIGKSWGGGEGASPAIDGDALFGQTNMGDNYCIGLDGKLRWVNNCYSDFKGFLMNPQYGFPQTPLVDDKNVILNPGGPEHCVVALNRDTGLPNWSISAEAIKSVMKSEKPKGSDRAAYSSAVVSEGGGQRHYVDLVGKGLIGFRPKDGKILWGYNLAGGEANIPTPIIRGDYVYCCNSYGAGTVLLKLSKDGEDGVKAEQVYHINLNNLEGQSVLVGDYTYTGEGGYSGNPVCVEFLTGKIMWKGKQKGAGVAGLTSVEGKLIFRAESGEVSLFEANPKECNMISWFKPEDGSKGNEAHWSHPVVSHGMLFIRQHDTLLAYDLKKK